jgi:putative tricarboxylic transport membrane protein
MEREDKPAASVRSLELWTAALVLLLGLLVLWDSRRLGSSWGEDGPEPGYFPFYIGLLICISAVVTLVTAFRQRELRHKPFVSREQLKLILIVLLPTIVYVSLIAYLGLYVASTVYIALFMWRLGKYSWLTTLPVSIGVSVAFFLVFEVWFKVPLPKGPLEAALGLS